MDFWFFLEMISLSLFNVHNWLTWLAEGLRPPVAVSVAVLIALICLSVCLSVCFVSRTGHSVCFTWRSFVPWLWWDPTGGLRECWRRWVVPSASQWLVSHYSWTQWVISLQVYQDGVRNMRVRFILRGLALPVVTSLLLAVTLPYVIAAGLIPMFGKPSFVGLFVCLFVCLYVSAPPFSLIIYSII